MGILGRERVGKSRVWIRAHATCLAAALVTLMAPGPAASSSMSMAPPAAPLQSGPPEAAFISPPSGALISGTGDVRVLARDDTGVATPVEFYYANPATPSTHLGQSITSADAPGISAPGEEVTLTASLDTTRLPDAEYRLAARLTDTGANHTLITETIRTDNTAPRVVLTAPHSGRAEPVSDSYQISGHLDDANLASWSLIATGPGWRTEITSGTSPLTQGVIGTYSGSMAPPGYVGEVGISLAATDSAYPPNVSAVSGRIYSDYYLDAYGRIDLAPSYEVSTTIPIVASVTGELASWRLDVRREGEAEPLITRVGTETGEALHIADFDVANTYGPGRFVFDLAVTDTSGESMSDHRVVEFIWRPAYLAVTYVGPPLSGPGPTTPLTEFTDPTISGIVEVRGQVSGSNTWAWALGRPITLGEPSFSGDKIVFSANIDDPYNFDIYQLKLDGSELIRLTNHPGYDHAPKFSPDGARIVFSSTRDHPAPQGGTDAYVMGANGTNIERVTFDGYSLSPAFSPGATHIAVQRPGGIFEIELATGATEQLTFGEDYHPSYSPVGSRLIFDRGTRGAQQVFDADLSSPGYPTRQLVFAPGFSGYPQYSPDGERIVYSADYEITVAGADGSDPRGLGALGHDPTFVPDASQIVYAEVPISGPNKIFLIGSDPDDPSDPQELVVPGSSRAPDVSSPQLPFPPSPAKNPGEYTPIDIASFAKSPDPLTYLGYLRAPPDQLPQGERGADSVLGYIDASRLPPGVTSLSLTALQCPTVPPTFDYGLEIPPDAETEATVAAITTCNAYSTPQIPLRVYPKTASIEATVHVRDSDAGYAEASADGRSFSAAGAYRSPDGFVFAPRQDRSSPLIARTQARSWASGYPASDGASFVPVPDLMALEDIDLLIGEPALGLKVLAGSPELPTPVACGELFAPGRLGCRYEVDIAPGHLGSTNHLTAYTDERTDLLGALAYQYSYPLPVKRSALPGPGGWPESQQVIRSVAVRIEFSGYGYDTELAVPDIDVGEP